MSVCTEEQLERIDAESLRILAQVGVRIDDQALRQRAILSGAAAAPSGGRVRLPAEMVREFRQQAPSRVLLADGQGKLTEVGPGCAPTFWTGAALDYVTGRAARAFTAADLADFARLADSLDGVFAVVGTSIEEVPPSARDFVGFSILAGNTSKHLRPLLFTAAGVEPIIEMAEVLAEGQPLAECPVVSFGYTALSGLRWPEVCTEMWRRSSGYKLPVMVNAEPLAGGTTPATLAGSIAMSNAAALSGVVLTQLLEPGRPVIYNIGFAHAMDMRGGTCLAGSAQCALLGSVGGQLGRFYNLPSAAWMGTDALMDDQQASMEKALTGFAYAQAGCDVIWGMGQLGGGRALSPVQLLMDNELVRGVRRFRRGIDVDANSLSFEAVREVLETGADFLGHPHTLRHFRDELSVSDLLNRSVRETWEQAGAPSLAEKAQQRARESLQSDRPPKLTDAQAREIEQIKQRALKAVH